MPLHLKANDAYFVSNIKFFAVNNLLILTTISFALYNLAGYLLPIISYRLGVFFTNMVYNGILSEHWLSYWSLLLFSSVYSICCIIVLMKVRIVGDPLNFEVSFVDNFNILAMIFCGDFCKVSLSRGNEGR